MRQILFRGKDKDGQWREGNLHQCWDGVAIISGWVDVSPSIRQHFTTQVDSATVGQWTGAVVENGVKLWEGDEVETLDHETGVVFWEDERHGWSVEIANVICDLGTYTVGESNEVDLVVIGNIHTPDGGKEVE